MLSVETLIGLNSIPQALRSIFWEARRVGLLLEGVAEVVL